METGKSINEVVLTILSSLENAENVGMTKEETAMLIQNMKQFGPILLELDEKFKKATKLIQEYRQTILQLDAEIASSEAFISSKGLSSEYENLKNKKLKVLNRNLQKGLFK